MNTLALIGAGLAVVVGLIVATAKLAAKVERERIRRWLAEQAVERQEEATQAHDQAAREGREKYL